MVKIQNIKAREILDSRGTPTIEVEIILSNGVVGKASVPSGASVGTKEAIELRDGGKRYDGKGVLNAIDNIYTKILPILVGNDATDLSQCDKLMLELDGTPNKAKLGANAILGVSVALARAAAINSGKELYQNIGGEHANILPMPLMNILNGGVHADNELAFQECMIVPYAAENFAEAVRMGAEVFYALKKHLKQIGLSTNVGDEGGVAPNVKNLETALDLIMEAIKQVGFNPASDIGLALDSAASEFYRNGKYNVDSSHPELSSEEFVQYYMKIVDNYPIVSIEDAMSEIDHAGWILITEKLGHKLQLVGDDIFVTNKSILKEAIKNKIANAILIKPNQIGSLSETLETIKIAQENNYATILSHRSGETNDTLIAHLAVAMRAKQIKTGSLCRGERVAKYNELMRIEEQLGSDSVFPRFLLRKN